MLNPIKIYSVHIIILYKYKYVVHVYSVFISGLQLLNFEHLIFYAL